MKTFAQLVFTALTLAATIPSAQSQVAQPAEQEVMRRSAVSSADQQIYEQFRRWRTQNKSTVSNVQDALSRYRKVLVESGSNQAEADRQVELIRTKGQQLEIERWNRALTSQEPRFNTEPNAFLMEVVAGRPRGRALERTTPFASSLPGAARAVKSRKLGILARWCGLRTENI